MSYASISLLAQALHIPPCPLVLLCPTMKEAKVTKDLLVVALRPIANKYGRSLCKYPCEGTKIESAKLIIKEVPPEYLLLAALHKLANNLTFTRSIIKEALLATYIEQEWKMSAAEKVRPHGRNSVNL